MRSVFTLAIAGLCLSSIAFAQQQPTDDEIKTAFAGKKVAWGSDGIADYKADGSYEYFNQNDGKTYRGKYSVVGGSVCAVFPNGQNRCDKIMKDDKGFYMVNRQGTQYRAAIR